MKTANFSFALCLSVVIMLFIKCTRSEQDLSVTKDASAQKSGVTISAVNLSNLIAYKTVITRFRLVITEHGETVLQQVEISRV